MNIKSIRRAYGLSQYEMGQFIGVHSMTVSKWECSEQANLPEMQRRVLQLMLAEMERRKRGLRDVLLWDGPVVALRYLCGGED